MPMFYLIKACMQNLMHTSLLNQVTLILHKHMNLLSEKTFFVFMSNERYGETNENLDA